MLKEITPAEERWSCEILYGYLTKQASHFGMLMLDTEGKIIYWNKGAQKIFGYTEAEAIGMDVTALFVPEDQAFNVSTKELAAALKVGHADDERWHLHKDGSRMWISGITSAVENDAGELIGFSKMLRETTLRKKSEEDNAAASSRFAKFAYMASHDLKEPLRMVTSFLNLLEKRLAGKLDKESEEFLRYALDGGRRMQVLINQLLEHARTRDTNLLIRETDCNAVVDSALSFLKLNIDEKNAIITRAALPVINGFPTLLTQLFQNLIGNAIKYQPVGAQPQVFVDAKEQGDSWLFSVRDNGIGIAENARERIFAEFQRLHGPEDYPGSGLGLTICKEIVQRHGGRIWVESKVGAGSTFWFTIAKSVGAPARS